MKKYQYLFICGLMLLPFLSVAQRQADSLQALKRNNARVFNEDSWFAFKGIDAQGGTAYDTSLDFFNRFDPAYKKQIAWQDLGFPCSPVLPLLMNAQRKDRGFILANQTLDPLFRSERNYYRTPIALSDLKYAQGPPNLIFLEALHTQNIRPNWNAGLEYRHCASSNQYFDNLPNRERTRMGTLFGTRLFSSYVAPDSSYAVLFDGELHRNTLQETGGLSDELNFELVTGRDRNLNNQANLGAAQNRFNRNSLALNQQWKRDIGAMRLKSELGRDINRFESAEQIWFKDNFFSTNTFDSLRHFYFTNEWSLARSIKQIEFQTGLHHGYYKISQPQNTEARYNNTGYFLGIRFSDSMSRFIRWDQYLSGYNAGDLSMQFVWSLNTGTFGKAELRGLGLVRTPDFLQQYFVSNHYLWGTEQLNKEIHTHFDLKWIDLKDRFYVLVSSGSVAQKVFYNASSLPEQIDGSWNYLSALLGWKFKLGILKADLSLVFQQQNRTLLAFPKAAGKMALYTEFYAFNRNMKIQSGLDVLWHSAYQLNGYNPAIRQFIPANGRERSQMNLNIFLNAEVRTVRAFVMYQRFNDLMDTPLYASENHPQLPATIRFGIGWLLYN